MFPRCRIFKWLLFASVVWLTVLFCFYQVLGPENGETVEQLRQGLMIKPMKLVEVQTSSTRKINYVTPAYDFIQKLNLTNPGENGVAVNLPNASEDIQKLIKEGWERHQFNEFVSELISVRRSLPDPRNEYCSQDNLYLENLPKTSVIIIFHNEAWTTLLRSVHSVLDRSPEHLLEEIILVDDASTMDHLKQPLEDYMAQFPKVKVIRASERKGLIHARLLGSYAAKAPALTFLDSHIECAPYWLEPLLDRIARDPTTVVAPIIEVINDDTFKMEYTNPKNLQVGGFDWDMTFNWHFPRKDEVERRKNESEPLRSPTMAGGLFMIDAGFFEKLGRYDPEFEFWGSEHLELSFKTWMCGGTLEFIPCSRIGHVFRKNSPHKWTGENKHPGRKNTLRLIEVWLDDYKEIYYKRSGHKKYEFGDISQRVQLRKDLGCKSFKWYMENVCPEINVPNLYGEGEIKSKALPEMCLDGVVEKGKGRGTISMYSCHGTGGNQYFELDRNFEIRQHDHCLDFDGSAVIFYSCHGQGGNQKWAFNKNNSQIYQVSFKKCLTVDLKTKNILMETCEDGNDNQKWTPQFLYEEKLLKWEE